MFRIGIWGPAMDGAERTRVYWMDYLPRLTLIRWVRWQKTKKKTFIRPFTELVIIDYFSTYAI